MKSLQKASSFFRQLFTHHHEEPIKALENPINRQLYLTLYQIMRDHIFIYLTVDQDSQIFQSIILDIDPEKKTITIDDLFPQKHRFIGLEGHILNIATQIDGTRHYFKSKIIQMNKQGYAISYTVDIPEEMSEVQRRKSFRLNLTPTKQFAIRFLNAQLKHEIGKLRNISIDGAGFDAEGDLSQFWQPESILENCELILEGEKVFDLDLTIKTCQIIPTQHQIMSYIGVEFNDLTENQKNKLYKMIIKKQRAQLRENAKSAIGE